MRWLLLLVFALPGCEWLDPSRMACATTQDCLVDWYCVEIGTNGRGHCSDRQPSDDDAADDDDAALDDDDVVDDDDSFDDDDDTLEPAAQPGDIVITEILIDPGGDEFAQEWFEILNTTGHSIDLDAWTLGDRSHKP